MRLLALLFWAYVRHTGSCILRSKCASLYLTQAPDFGVTIFSSLQGIILQLRATSSLAFVYYVSNELCSWLLFPVLEISTTIELSAWQVTSKERTLHLVFVQVATTSARSKLQRSGRRPSVARPLNQIPGHPPPQHRPAALRTPEYFSFCGDNLRDVPMRFVGTCIPFGLKHQDVSLCRFLVLLVSGSPS